MTQIVTQMGMALIQRPLVDKLHPDYFPVAQIYLYLHRLEGGYYQDLIQALANDRSPGQSATVWIFE